MNNIYYTLMAGWCADAAGARLEFQRRKFTEQEATDAMHFVGNNYTGICNGQITDDSEMEIALFDALEQGREEEYFPVEHIAKKYIEWFHSNPYDIGNTTMNAFMCATDADTMATNAYNHNATSESNGSLMRCVPLALYLMNKPIEAIMNIVAEEVLLTHPSKVVSFITGIYCCILTKKFKTGGSFANLDLYIRENAPNTVLQWYNNANTMESLANYDAITNEGHVKHAFTFVIYFLKNMEKYTYETAIKEVLMCGGDTDTNAKIVGNLFGAYCGNCVPEYMMEHVLNTQSQRPYEYTVKKGLELIQTFKPK